MKAKVKLLAMLFECFHTAVVFGLSGSVLAGWPSHFVLKPDWIWTTQFISVRFLPAAKLVYEIKD